MNVREALDNIYKEFEKTYEEARKEGYEEADSNQRENAIYAYERGLNDAWECARKLILDTGYCATQLQSIFGDKNEHYILKTLTPTEAIAKIKEYEEKQKQTDDEIKVGDEVKHDGEQIGVVTQVDKYGYQIMDSRGEGGRWITDDIKKTGRHFPQIAEVLQQMQEEE